MTRYTFRAIAVAIAAATIGTWIWFVLGRLDDLYPRGMTVMQAWWVVVSVVLLTGIAGPVAAWLWKLGEFLDTT